MDRTHEHVLPTPGSCTYFLLCEAAEQVRIGRTKDVIRRTQHHQSGSGTPVVLLAIAWDYGLEGQLHRELAATQSHGEWFWTSPSLAACIREHADTSDATLDLIAAINEDGEYYYRGLRRRVRSESMKTYAGREERKEQSQAYYAANTEEVKEKRRRYFQSHKAKEKAAQRRYRYAHGEVENRAARKRRRENPGASAAYQRKRRREKPEMVNRTEHACKQRRRRREREAVG